LRYTRSAATPCTHDRLEAITATKVSVEKVPARRDLCKTRAQMADGDVNGAVAGIERSLPDRLENRGAREHAAGVGSEHHQDFHVARSYRDLVSNDDHQEVRWNYLHRPHDDSGSRHLRDDCSGGWSHAP